MKAIIITVAYNAETTIQFTIESILTQSYSDFVYYIIDNGSIDHTGEIIGKYAQADSRINVITQQENSIWAFFELLPDILKNHDKTDYLCSIDADDTYNSDYLEKMITFMAEERLDIAVCGNDFIESATKKVYNVRKLDNDLVLEGSGFSEYFTEYYQFMRTVWGKVYSVAVLLEGKFEPRYEMGYGGDTLFTIEKFRSADRIGILAESLHKYYRSEKSASYQFNVKRIISDRILFDVAHDFLITKNGSVSCENLNFLFFIYLYAIWDTLTVLLNAKINVTEKLGIICDIFQSRHTQELAQWSGAEEEKKGLFGQVARWVLSQEEARSNTGLETAADILAAMGVNSIHQIDGWQDDSVFLLLTRIKDRLIKKGGLFNADGQIVSIASKTPLLAGLDAGFLTYFCDIAVSILQLKEEKALRQIEDIIAQEADIPDEYIEGFLALGLKLSTKLEYTEDFIYFKKLQISLLIDLSRADKARDELADWDKILPNDPDFRDLRKMLAR